MNQVQKLINSCEKTIVYLLELKQFLMKIPSQEAKNKKINKVLQVLRIYGQRKIQFKEITMGTTTIPNPNSVRSVQILNRPLLHLDKLGKIIMKINIMMMKIRIIHLMNRSTSVLMMLMNQSLMKKRKIR